MEQQHQAQQEKTSREKRRERPVSGSQAPGPATATGPGSGRHIDPKERAAQGIPVTTSHSYSAPSTMQPTFKLEMYAPKPEVQRPFGIYNPYIPTVELAGNKKFSASAFQNLFAPTSAVACAPGAPCLAPVKMPVQNVYNLTLPGPTGGHIEMNRIYENILPGKDNKMTATTLGERLQTYDYVRQILVKIDDGEDISISSDNRNNLMSYIKLMELNPTYYSPIYNNPYRGLPFGMLIYRCCFPIRFEDISRSVVCAKNSIGLSLRLYALSSAEYYSNKLRQPIRSEYDVWRELA